MKFLGKTFQPVRVNATDQRHVAVNPTSASRAIINDRMDVTDRHRRRHRRRKLKVCAIFFSF